MRVLVCGLSLLLFGCGNSTPPPNGATSDAAAAATATATAAPSASAPPAPTASAIADAGPPEVADAGADACEPPPPPVVADNKVNPTEGPELQDRARRLLEAIAKDDPERAEAFWFPKEPFIPLKDIKDPGKYWSQLHRTYAKDIHTLHKKRKKWDGAEFVKFEGWSHPKWVKPGDEANKIGYYRAFHGKLRYRIDGKEQEIDVHTIITWQGRWYITHLRKFKK